MKKSEFLSYWESLEDLPEGMIAMRPIPYKHEGSTFTQDGIRLTGSREFIASVLARLTDMLEFENGTTRLQVSYQESTDRETGEPTGSYQCYIQVRMRGGQARIANALLGIE